MLHEYALSNRRSCFRVRSAPSRSEKFLETLRNERTMCAFAMSCAMIIGHARTLRYRKEKSFVVNAIDEYYSSNLFVSIVFCRFRENKRILKRIREEKESSIFTPSKPILFANTTMFANKIGLLNVKIEHARVRI